MRMATVEQSRRIDAMAQERFELSGDVLMEAAGVGAAREIEQTFLPELKRGLVGIVCGPGNNGADGLVVARHLHSAGYRDLCVFLVAPQASRSELFRKQLKRVELQGLRIIDGLEAGKKGAGGVSGLGVSGLDEMRSCVLLVDAIFGLGSRARIDEPFKQVIEIINAASCPIVSLDLPSGLDADRGTVANVGVRAAMTVTFGLAKPGFFVNEGPSRVGRLRVLPIGLPFQLLRELATSHFGFGEKLARRYLPKRQATSNKTNHGHVVVFAGRPGMWGAGLLSSLSAYRIGAGYVTLSSFAEPHEVVAASPEILTAAVDDPKTWDMKKNKAFAIGPGLGVGQATADLIRRLRESGATSVVVDADAITTCVDFNLFPLPKTWVMTPHAGELARVLKVDAKTIEGDRFHFAREASRLTGCLVLLKGYRSVLASGDRCLVILSGNSALAKAGTGDVLTGMIAGFLAQGVEPVQAAATAAYIHGRMADEWVRAGNDQSSLTASDLKDHLPVLMARLASGALV